MLTNAGGADFYDLAREHSTCGSSGKKGGELGWLSRGSYYPDFESVAFVAPVGVVTRAVTQRGAHLLKVTAERFESPVAQMTVQELAELLSNDVLVGARQRSVEDRGTTSIRGKGASLLGDIEVTLGVTR